MNLFLVHHADALDPHVDPQRPLSTLGMGQATWLAAEAHAAGVAPALIWHSGKLRSRQTAEAFLRACNPFASFKMVRGLAPDDSLVWICDAIEAEDQDVMVVGHMPHLPALATRLSSVAEVFPLHGIVWLERVGARRYDERWRLAPNPE
jgi:phosphohistidine phosphatase